MTYCINCSPENDVFQALMSVCAHYNQIGVDLLSTTDNFGFWISGVLNNDLDIDALRLQIMRNIAEVLLASGDFRGGGEWPIDLARDTLFDVQQVQLSAGLFG